MSCLLSKAYSVKTCVQIKKLTVSANHFFPRRAFNEPFRRHKRQQSFTSSLFKPTLFCLTVSSGAIVVATIAQYERVQKSIVPIRLQTYYRQRQNIMNQNNGIFSNLKNLWNKTQPSEKIFGTILFLNALVFLAWQIPRWQGTMIKYFTTDALAKRIPVSSLLLSAFSHSSLVHLSFNMFALHSFCRGVIQWGDMAPEEFTAMYISSCVVSSLASIVFRRRIKSPGISLGASGAILSVVAYFSISHPKEHCSIIFLPTLQFEAIYALYGIVSLDTLGLILRWKVLDHAAHLGGTIFGLIWYKYISMYVWGNRKYIVNNWIMLKQMFQTKSRRW